MGPQRDRIYVSSNWTNAEWWIHPPYGANAVTSSVPDTDYKSAMDGLDKLFSMLIEQEKDLNPGNTEAIDEFLNEFIHVKEKGFDT